jgi:hypothetical protein
MQYTQPYGVTDPNAGYVNGNPATGTQGSIPPGPAIEAPQREIVAVIEAFGLTPNPANTAQLLQVLQQITRMRLQANLTLFVNPTGSDTNNGLTLGTPFQTLQHAWSWAQISISTGSFSPSR